MANKDKLSYWELRAVLEERELYKLGDKYEQKVIDVYNKARDYLTNAVDELYKRYDAKTSLNETQIKAVLNDIVSSADLVALQNIVKTIDDKETMIKVQEYLDWMAVKSRITKMEELKAKAYIVSKQLADVQLEQSTNYYINAINDAYSSASREAIIGKTQTEAGVYKGRTIPKVNRETNKIEFVKPENKVHVKAKISDSFSELSTREVKNILETPWLGSNYSKRIWNDTDLLAKKLQELFAVSEMTGMSQREMAEKISKEFNTGIGVAKRLIRTEANHVHNQAKLAGWKDHGVEKYSLVAVLDFRTSQKCRDIDGKVFDVSNAAVNVNFPPLHPWCRTVAVAWFSYAKYGGNRTANDPITGETFKLNDSDTYKDWEQILIKKHGKAKVMRAMKKIK
ncbi:hypothetical protein GKC51_01195 [Weissella koreensis]|nr:hypothetical protein GKC51_01195 [Weissella koreensis]